MQTLSIISLSKVAIITALLYLFKPSFNDVIDSINIVNDSVSIEEEELMGQIYRCLELFPESEKEATLCQLLASEAYSKIAHRKEEMLGVLRNGEQ